MYVYTDILYILSVFGRPFKYPRGGHAKKKGLQRLVIRLKLTSGPSPGGEFCKFHGDWIQIAGCTQFSGQNKRR